MQKSQILKELKAMNVKTEWHKCPTTGRLLCSNGGKILPKTGTEGWGKEKRETKDHREESDDQVPLTDTIPDEIQQTDIDDENERNDNINRCLLSYINIDQSDAIEMESTNASTEHWREEIESLVTEERGSMLEHGDNTFEIELLLHEEEQSEEHMVTEPSNEKNDEHCIASETDRSTILEMLRTDKNTNTKGQWDDKSCQDLKICLSSEENISKLRDVELRIIVRYLKRKCKAKITESESKKSKVEKISKLLGYSVRKDDHKQNVPQVRSRKLKNVGRLADLALEKLSKKVPKQTLNIAMAEYIWPLRVKEWKDQSPLQDVVKVSGTNEPNFWFYIPEFSTKRGQLEVRCVDSTHLLTRMRRKCCHGGIEGMDSSPWIRVAKRRNTFLTLVMVEDIVDPMSMAITHFSEPVEKSMLENGDFRAASLCRDVRMWWRAEDDPAIPALERIKMRSGLRDRLLKDVIFSKVPPTSMYIKGYPAKLWEAIVASIDAHAILYALSQQRTYNVRAFSSMMGESFFAELTNQDKRGHGTLTAEEFSSYISYATEQMQARLDKDRSFSYRTSRSSVYRPVENLLEDATEIRDDDDDDDSPKRKLTCIKSLSTKDHSFDSSHRRRAVGRKKEGTVSTDINAVQKGSLGVRWETARVNESKILPFRKLGFDLQEVNALCTQSDT